MPEPLKAIHIVTLVWGVEYLDFFLEYSLKSQLTPRNIPELSSAFQLTYHIYTDRDGKSTILSSSIFKKLSKYCKIEFSDIEGYFGRIPDSQRHNLCYEMMMLSHKEAIDRANEKNAGIIINYPDVYYASSFFGELKEPILNGKRAIFISAIRTIKEKVLLKLTNLNRADLEQHNKIMEIGISSVFPYERRLIDNVEMDSNWSSLIFFNLGQDSFALKNFNPNIFFFWPREKRVFTEKNTIDNCNYLFEIGLKKGEFYYGDTRNFFFFECSAESKFALHSHTYFIKRSIMQYIYWMHLNMRPNQLQFLDHSSIFEIRTKSEISNLIKKIKMEFFSFRLKFLYKLGSTILKPFLYKPYLAHKYQLDKSYQPNFIKFLRKEIVKNYYETELIKMATHERGITSLLEFIIKFRQHIRSPIYPELFKSIRKSQSNQDFFSLFETLLYPLNFKTASILYLNFFPNNFSNENSAPISEGSQKFPTKFINELLNKKKPNWIDLKHCGRIFRKALSIGNVELIKSLMDRNIHLRIRKKYLKHPLLIIIHVANRLRNGPLFESYFLCLLNLFDASNTHLNYKIKNHSLFTKQELLDELIGLLLKRTSYSRVLKELARGFDEESSLIFLNYFLKHNPSERKYLDLIGKVFESSIKNNQFRVIRLFLDHKIEQKISKKYLIKLQPRLC